MLCFEAMFKRCCAPKVIVPEAAYKNFRIFWKSLRLFSVEHFISLVSSGRQAISLL